MIIVCLHMITPTVGLWANICITHLYVIPMNIRSYAFCAALPNGASILQSIKGEEASMSCYHSCLCATCMLLNAPLGSKNKDPWVDYPQQHIKHVHGQS